MRGSNALYYAFMHIREHYYRDNQTNTKKPSNTQKFQKTIKTNLTKTIQMIFFYDKPSIYFSTVLFDYIDYYRFFIEFYRFYILRTIDGLIIL